jgi:tRNA threonylcarbamoyladenosine biosynthesis protein TsaB
MALILNLETATKACSVSLSENGTEIKTIEVTTAHFSHSENLTVFIQDLMKSSGYQLADLDAVAVSEGPGSYTGLRIGVSAGKGLCYALDIPMIAVNSLMALASRVQLKKGELVCPLFDAMRMEVYAAIFDADLNTVLPTAAVVIDAHSFESFLAGNRVVFVGPGAAKCQDLITHANAYFDTTIEFSAKGMMRIAEQKFNAGAFVDLAYFEPFYLKDFIAGDPKKLL